jgi:hypothetical protein
VEQLTMSDDEQHIIEHDDLGLPTFTSSALRMEGHGGKPTALDQFIYENEPAGPASRTFRLRLSAMLNEASLRTPAAWEALRTERDAALRAAEAGKVAQERVQAFFAHSMRLEGQPTAAFTEVFAKDINARATAMHRRAQLAESRLAQAIRWCWVWLGRYGAAKNRKLAADAHLIERVTPGDPKKAPIVIAANREDFCDNCNATDTPIVLHRGIGEEPEDSGYCVPCEMLIAAGHSDHAFDILRDESERTIEALRVSSSKLDRIAELIQGRYDVNATASEALKLVSAILADADSPPPPFGRGRIGWAEHRAALAESVASALGREIEAAWDATGRLGHGRLTLAEKIGHITTARDKLYESAQAMRADLENTRAALANVGDAMADILNVHAGEMSRELFNAFSLAWEDAKWLKEPEFTEGLESLRGTIRDLRARLAQHEKCGQDGVCAITPGCDWHWAERNRELVAERDALAKALADARATNAALHRRAQGVEAGAPEDAELIRRLRREVASLSKRTGTLYGMVHRHYDARIAAERSQRAHEIAAVKAIVAARVERVPTGSIVVPEHELRLISKLIQAHVDTLPEGMERLDLMSAVAFFGGASGAISTAPARARLDAVIRERDALARDLRAALEAREKSERCLAQLHKRLLDDGRASDALMTLLNEVGATVKLYGKELPTYEALHARMLTAERERDARPLISPETAIRAFHGHDHATKTVRRALEAHGAHAKHVHPCPTCYEQPECVLDCSWEADDDTGPLRGAHSVCAACEAKK